MKEKSGRLYIRRVLCSLTTGSGEDVGYRRWKHVVMPSVVKPAKKPTMSSPVKKQRRQPETRGFAEILRGAARKTQPT